jgi:predicted MFS family arabinose efflux permease
MGVTLMASQIGGALAPLVVVPIQMRWGWSVPFFLFGSVGILWATVWYIWFRDSPAERIRGIASVGVSASNPHQSAHAFPWQTAFRSSNLLAFLVIAFSYVYVYNFFQTWFHTFLVKGRGFSEAGLFLSALPYVVATFANLLGGAVSDALVRRLGRLNGRRAIGSSALGAAGVFTIAAMLTNQQVMTVVFLALVYGAITFQQSGALAVCLDIGHEYAGAMTGLFNTASQLGGLLGSVAYGYIVERSGSYNAPFVPMIALLFLGSLLWLRVDASQALAPESALPTLASR